MCIRDRFNKYHTGSKTVSQITNRFEDCETGFKPVFKTLNNGGRSRINKATHLSLELQTRRLFKANLEPKPDISNYIGQNLTLLNFNNMQLEN